MHDRSCPFSMLKPARRPFGVCAQIAGSALVTARRCVRKRSEFGGASRGGTTRKRNSIAFMWQITYDKGRRPSTCGAKIFVPVNTVFASERAVVEQHVDSVCHLLLQVGLVSHAVSVPTLPVDALANLVAVLDHAASYALAQHLPCCLQHSAGFETAAANGGIERETRGRGGKIGSPRGAARLQVRVLHGERCDAFT